jgi:hypothetical protein
MIRLRFTICAGILFGAAAAGQMTDEYHVKAAFLYNFAKFVEWPPQAFKGPADPIAICILGKDPFGDALKQAVQGKTIEGRPFNVRGVPNVQEASSCHILFIAGSERKHLRATLSAMRGPAILTVGETEGFASEGGMINFKIDANRVRLQINMAVVEQAKLGISSKLLGLSEIVRSDGN